MINLSSMTWSIISRNKSKSASITDKKTLRKLSTYFFLSNGVLYKRKFDMILLRSVDRHEAKMIIKEICEGSFGILVNGHAMAKKIVRVGYYWITTKLTVSSRPGCGTNIISMLIRYMCHLLLWMSWLHHLRSPCEAYMWLKWSNQKLQMDIISF